MLLFALGFVAALVGRQARILWRGYREMKRRGMTFEDLCLLEQRYWAVRRAIMHRHTPR